MEPENVDDGWTAQWIWCHDSGIDKTGEFMANPRIAPRAYDRRVLFRKRFKLAAMPVDGAPLLITADSRYVLWVNGTEMARGPARSQPARLSYDVVDVAPWLVRGTNVICVLVRFYGLANAWWVPATPTFSHGAGVLLAELRLPGQVVATDTSWRYAVADAWQPQQPEGVGGFVPEVLDGRLLDPDWLTADYPDNGWRAARVVIALHLGGTSRSRPPTDPYGAVPLGRDRPPTPVLRPSRGAVLRDAPCPDPDLGPAHYVAHADVKAREVRSAQTFPIDLTVAPETVWVLTVDWEQIVAGTVVLDIDAPTGLRVDLRMCEELDADGRIPAHHQLHGVRYLCRGVREEFESFDPAGGRHAVLVLTGAGRVRIHGVGIRERLRARPPGAFFECDDPLLNRIYQVGLRTVDLSAQDAYLDCPTREQRAWVGDSVVHQAVDLLTNPDWALARRNAQLCASPRPDGMLPMAAACDFEYNTGTCIPDWALHWVRSVHNLFRWTGDAELIAELLPVAERVLRWFTPYLRDGLLTDVPGWVLIDWASVQGRGASAALNGLWARGLRDLEEMAQWLGDNGRANWAWRAHSLLVGPYQRFWDPARGAYRDWSHEGQVLPACSDHATAAAVAGGLVRADRRAAALAFLLERGGRVRRAWSFQAMPLRAAMGPPPPDWDTSREVVEAQPFFRYVVHDAVAELGAAGRVAGLCRDWAELLASGDGTWRETWSGGSRCHGWSSTPTRDLPLYTLGVSPHRPGFRKALIAPRLGDLAWARGAVPTPYGLIEVSVGDRLEVNSPVPFVLDLGRGREPHPAGHFACPLAEVPR